MHANQVTSSEGLLFYVQPAFDATLSTFLSNLQRALDATRSTFLSNLQRALDATRSTFLSKHLFPVVFHDACIMESKHKNIQNFVSSFTDTVGRLTLEELLKEVCKAVKACKCVWDEGKNCFSNPKRRNDMQQKSSFTILQKAVFQTTTWKVMFRCGKNDIYVDLMLTKPHGCARDIAATSRLCGSGMGILKPFLAVCLQEVMPWCQKR